MENQVVGSLNFSRECKSLTRGVVPEELASGKLVYCEVCSEGSQTAEFGTDEQERYMRHINLGQASTSL